MYNGVYYENYMVSDDGLIFSKYTNKPLKPQKQRGGYYKISLYKDRKPVNAQYHRVVCCTFHGYCPDLVVNHKDGDKLNNHPNNLEWVTQSENRLHAHRVLGKQNGEDNPASKLTEDDVRFIKQSLENNYYGLQSELARKFNVDNNVIFLIKKGRLWKNVK